MEGFTVLSEKESADYFEALREQEEALAEEGRLGLEQLKAEEESRDMDKLVLSTIRFEIFLKFLALGTGVTFCVWSCFQVHCREHFPSPLQQNKIPYSFWGESLCR
jgi:hypothetical protein